MSASITLTVNGEQHRVEAERGARLLTFLREELGLIGTKNGCGVGQCGSCSVLIDGEVKRACTTRIADLEGADIFTIEGMSRDGSLHPIQQAFIDENAVQCGFCTPGMIMAARGLLERTPDPDEKAIRNALDPNLCRCTGYAAIVRAVQRAATLMRAGAAMPSAVATDATSRGVATDGPAVGTSVERVDARAKVSGARVFAADYSAEGMLYGALALSEEDHARVVRVDTAAAAATDGVVRVLTAVDIPGRNGFGLFVPHQPVLADEFVRYRGEPVAFVVAETEAAARRAAGKVRAEYEGLPVLHGPDEALAAGAPELHEGGNVAEIVRFTRGDAERAFAEADLVVEGEYHTQPVEHAYLEPESCLAVPGEAPQVTVYTANQGSGAFREMIAASLALDESAVRVVYTPAGGGFGGKEEPTVQIHAALAAHLLGVPVKVTLDRTSSIRISTKRHASRIRIAHAVRADGRLLAVRTRTVCDAGAYLSLTKPVVFRTAVMAGGPYEVPSADVESIGVYTNTNPAGAFRGFGSTQISFAVEVQMDKIARRLGIDPVDLRRRNALAPGKVTATGHRLGEGTGYPETIERVAGELERVRAELTPAPGKRIGIGFAGAYKNVGIGKGLPDEASAAVELREDGTIAVYVGATDMGQGSDTVMAQIAADTLSVPFGLVQVISSDTQVCPDAGMTTASRQTFISGNAVAGAARELAVAAGLGPGTDDGVGESPPGTAERAGESLRPPRWAREALAERATGRAAAGDQLRFEYRYRPPATVVLPEFVDDAAPPADDGYPIHFAYCFTSMAAVVEVSPDGRDLRVLRLITAQDVGRALHPGNVRGQVEGAAVMGYGFGVREHFECGRNGRATTTMNALSLPRFTDAPRLSTFIVEAPDPNGPFGAKGIGEIPLNPAAPAIAAAIHDATGVYPETLPMAPEGRVRATDGLHT
jgi:CO/xanthine dehydrogenase Mo-binding subunit/aerobic-type carbon monoxide dehydrogenase small subunit (CoxS/CutS family)